MSLVRKRIVLPLIPTDIFQVIRPTQNKDAVLDLTYQQLISALSEIFSGGGSLILLKTNGTDNPNQNILNLVAGTGVTLDVNDQGDVTINSFGGSFITSITDTATIDLDVTSGVLTGNLVDVATAGSYGSGTQVPQITIDSKGRVTSVSLINITAGAGTVTLVGVNPGTGISATISGNPNVNPTINITNTAPDVVVGIAGSDNVQVTGSYPSFTIKGYVSASQRLLGRYSTGAGVSEEITIGTGLNLSTGGVLTSTGGTGAVSSVSGTANRIAVTPTTGAVVVNIDTNYVGQNTITTLGTIGTGTWQGTAIGTTYGGTGLTSIGSALQYLRVNSGASGLEYASLPLTAKGDLFTRNNTADAALALGLNTQVLTVDTSTATGLKWGTNTAPTPLGYYGQYFSYATQNATTINVGKAMIFETLDLSNGITVVTDGTALTKITFANTGIYNLQFSTQFQNTDNAEQDVYIWLRKNGTTSAADVLGSTGLISIPKTHGGGGGTPGHVIVTWNFLLDIVAGDFYQIVWSTSNISAVSIKFLAATANHPSTASTLFTVTQQSGIMAGTGMTALTTTGTSGASTYNSLTGVLNVPIYGGGSGGNSILSLATDVVASATAPSQTNVSAALALPLKTGSFGVNVDGITALIQVGIVGFVVMPYGGTITGWSITANAVGSIQFDVWRATNAIPTSGNTQTPNPLYRPKLSNAQLANSTDVTSWTTTFAKDDVFGFYVDSASGLKNAVLTIRCTKSPS